jgi:DNA-binding NarL/FixJ family response regulator
MGLRGSFVADAPSERAISTVNRDETVDVCRVAIVERLPAYRRGLAATFAEAGFSVEELSSLDERARVADAVVFTIDSETSWTDLAGLVETPGVVVVALLEDATLCNYRRALRLGLSGTVPREAPTELIVSAVCAALEGTTLLPCLIARQLADRQGAEGPLPISENEASWLRAMADGVTIASMAQAARYSERQMHRLIANLYKQIGAANRQQALVFAARYGILDS